jgi:hypothetical protein
MLSVGQYNHFWTDLAGPLECALAKGIFYDSHIMVSYCLPKLITLTSAYCISKLTTKHSKNIKMQYIFSPEFFHLILNKSLVCALINEHKLVIVKTNQ